MRRSRTPLTLVVVVVAGAVGSIVVHRAQRYRIARVSTSGAVTEYAIPTPGSNPTGITTAFGHVWFAESAGNKIGRVLVTP